MCTCITKLYHVIRNMRTLTAMPGKTCIITATSGSTRHLRASRQKKKHKKRPVFDTYNHFCYFWSKFPPNIGAKYEALLCDTRYVPHDFSLGHFLMCEKSAFKTQMQNGPSIGTRSKPWFFHEVPSPVFRKVVINVVEQFNEMQVMYFRIINHRKNIENIITLGIGWRTLQHR